MLANPTVRVSIKEILLATDFSVSAEHALDYAVSIARRYESRVNVVHAITAGDYAAMMADGAVDTLDMVRQSRTAQLCHVAGSVARENLPVREILSLGSPAKVAERICTTDAIDLIVLGTQGAKGLKHFLLGSVAEEIVRSSKCPVLAVGPHVKNRPQWEASFRNILFATDLGIASERAASYALSLAQEYEAKLTLLHVVPNVADPGPGQRRVAHYFLKELKSYVPEDASAWCELDYAVRYGEAASQIIDVAREHNCDLIVLGARAQSHTDTFFRSSTVYSVLCTASCPVLTVRG